MVGLVERARAGDVEAFGALVAGHQALAQAGALAHLRDPDAARDVVQESFVAAWRGLGSLADPRAFPAWLRGIVRRQALHALRARALASIEDAPDLPGEAPSAEERLEAARRRDLARIALRDLPAGLREPAVLYYLHECSQAQIAAFLALPVTTVNNRLHAARARLRRRRLAMTKAARRDAAPPAALPPRLGRIVHAAGPVVEMRFEPAEAPELFSVLTAADERGRTVTVEVVQRLSDGRVRGIARDPDATLGPDMQVVDRGVPADTRTPTPEHGVSGADPRALARAVEQLARPPAAAAPELLETGVKVVDVLLPIARGGAVGVLGGERVGTIVVTEELLRRLAPHPAAFFVFAPWVGAAGLADTRAEGYGLGTDLTQALFFVGDGAPLRERFDTVIALSPALAREGMWPAIDPLASRSAWVTPAAAGAAHAAVAARVRACLEEAAVIGLAGGPRDATARVTVRRARQLREYFTQPFFVAEAYTRRPGAFVPRDEAVATCAAILDGAHDAVPESAFHFVGGLDEALARARTTAREAAPR